MKKITLILFVCVLSFNAKADLENPRSLPVGDREAFMANAGVALTGSPGNMFYNPAGLSELTGTRFTAGGSAYALASARFTSSEGISSSMDEFLTVPNMAVSSRRFGDWTAAFGVFIPISMRFSIEAEQNQPSLNGNLHIKADTEGNDQFIGIAAGRKLENNWSVGLSLFAHHYTTKSISTAYLQPYSGSVYVQQGNWQDSEFLNLLSLAGVQKKLNENWLLGITLALPELKVKGKNHQRSEQLISNGGAPTQTITSNEYDANYSTPLDLAGGLKYESGNWLLTTNIAVQFPTTFDSVPGSTLNDHFDTKTTFRENLGVEYKISNENSILAGLSRSPDTTGGTVDANGKTNTVYDFYSTTLGYYTRQARFTSGIGLEYTVSTPDEKLFSFEMGKDNGARIFGVLASTSIEF